MTFSTRAVSVWSSTQAVHNGQRVWTNLNLWWDVTDPLAVKISVHYGTQRAVAAVARDLLSEGMVRRTGAGQIRVEPVADHVVLTITAPGEIGQIVLRPPWLADFLERTFAITPAGCEYRGEDPEQELQDMLEAA